MNNSIYQIKDNENNLSICFFCYIKYKKRNIPVMISNNKVINEKYLSNNNGIKILINNEITTIKFGKAKYINKDYDLSIIQIIENNLININILDIDENLLENESELYYDKKTIYIFNINNENSISVSYGVIKDINNSEIKYLSYKNLTNERWPIFSSFNNKIIAIYQNYIF